MLKAYTLETHILINLISPQLDLQIGKVNYRDQFEWELQNEKTNAPEVFSRQLAAELGVGGEYVAIISHAIREQLFKHKRQYVEEVSSIQKWNQTNS